MDISRLRISGVGRWSVSAGINLIEKCGIIVKMECHSTHISVIVLSDPAQSQQD